MPCKDPRRRKEYNHQYYLRQKARDYEAIKQGNRESYQRNKKKVLACTQRYYQENKEQHAGWMRTWWRRNKRRLLEYRSRMNRRWRQENPGKERALKARRRARETAVPSTLTPVQAERLLDIGRAMYPGEQLHLDHIVPLSKGGGTTLANMRAIPASLNLSKHDKLPEDVYEQQPLWAPLG